jgi:hypothetical protein
MVEHHRKSLVPITAVIGLVLLSGCVIGPDLEDGIEVAIEQHYAGRATEEDGLCRTPSIDTIQAQQLVRSEPNGIEVLSVRYSYYDRYADMDVDYNQLFVAGHRCSGFAERKFIMQRTDLGYRVVSMGGDKRMAADTTVQ